MRTAQPKLIFINRYFYPDHSATSQMLTDLAFGLAKTESPHAMPIVNSRQRYDDASVKLLPFEAVNHVSIHRVVTTCFGRQNSMGRAVECLIFYLSAFITLIKLTQKSDTLIEKKPILPCSWWMELLDLRRLVICKPGFN